MSNEPVRWATRIAGVIAALATGLGILAGADPIEAQTWYLAGAVALGEVAVVFGAGEVARTRAWGPASHEEDVKANADARERAVHAGPPEDGYPPEETDPDEIARIAIPWTDEGL